MQGPMQLMTMLIVVSLPTTCLTCCQWGMTSRRFCLSDITQTRGGLKGWHNEFLDLCHYLGLFILNGRIAGDELGECTCFANSGSSLVDYMVTSLALFNCATSLVVHKCPLFCGKGGDSDHMPLSLNLQLPWQHVASTTSESHADIRHFKHDTNKGTQYCQHL
jgi:hypothetical protein